MNERRKRLDKYEREWGDFWEDDYDKMLDQWVDEQDKLLDADKITFDEYKKNHRDWEKHVLDKFHEEIDDWFSILPIKCWLTLKWYSVKRDLLYWSVSGISMSYLILKNAPQICWLCLRWGWAWSHWGWSWVQIRCLYLLLQLRSWYRYRTVKRQAEEQDRQTGRILFIDRY